MIVHNEHYPSGVGQLEEQNYRPQHLQPVLPAVPGVKQGHGPQTSFRHRGYTFLKKAGTNREVLSRYMLKQKRDWVRYATSTITRQVPLLAPKLNVNNAPFHYQAPVQDPEDFSFVIIGDTGMNSPGQYMVSTALSRQDLYPSEFCFILGDVMYPAGGAENYKYGLLEAFKYYENPVLAIPGNHDWYDNLNGFNQYFVRGNVPKKLKEKYDWSSPNLPNWFYYMDIGTSLRIICMDTGLTGSIDHYRQEQLEWLDSLLEDAGDRRVLLMTHHPLYSLSQRHHEKKLRNMLEPRLDKANIAVVFSGHDHNYQRHRINGTQYVIQGAGGATLQPLPSACMTMDQHGQLHTLTKRHPLWDQRFSFIHCRWHKNRLTCTTVSAHEVPGRILDQFVV